VAQLYFHRSVYKSGNKQATAKVRYLTRKPGHTLSRADQYERFIAEGREDLYYTQTRNLPDWARGSPHVYFREAAEYERANGNAFEEWKIMLPQDLSPRQNMALMRDLVDTIAGDRLPMTYAFHCPTTMAGTKAQPHLHLILSARQNDGIARTPQQYFKRYNRTHPERGGAPKDPALYHLKAVKQWRITITDVVNLHLERAGCEGRVHPDTLEAQGIERTPEPKLLPSESRAYREQGIVSPRMQEVLTIRANRERTRADEQASAVEYWDSRKAELGLTDTMDLPAQLTVIGEARALVRDQTPAQRQEQEAQRLHERGQEAADDAWLDAVLLWAEETGARALRDMGWEAVQEAREVGQEGLEAGLRRERVVAQEWEGVEQDLAALARQLDALDTGAGRSGRVPVRLWDKEREQGWGI